MSELKQTSSERDWPEDFKLENGNYYNICTTCRQEFMGYKRRFTCKVCAGQGAPCTPREAARHNVKALTARTTELVGEVIAKGMLGVLEECIEMQLTMNELKDRAEKAEAELAELRRTQPEARKDDSLRTSLADLAMALWRTHYRNDSPNFELLPDAAGILSQIDNMVSGLVKPEATTGLHPDDIAVDLFAKKMKEKMAKSRAKGRGGWNDPEQCHIGDLCTMLVEHVDKGDPVDVANIAMMLYHRGAKSWDMPTAMAAYKSPSKTDPHSAILAIPLKKRLADFNGLREFQFYCQGFAEARDAAAALASPVDALSAGDRVDAVADAARSVLREALDAAEVHPCDTNNDSARAKQLSPLMQNLYRAILQSQKAEQ